MLGLIIEGVKFGVSAVAGGSASMFTRAACTKLAPIVIEQGISEFAVKTTGTVLSASAGVIVSGGVKRELDDFEETIMAVKTVKKQKKLQKEAEDEVKAAVENPTEVQIDNNLRKDRYTKK